MAEDESLGHIDLRVLSAAAVEGVSPAMPTGDLRKALSGIQITITAINTDLQQAGDGLVMSMRRVAVSLASLTIQPIDLSRGQADLNRTLGLVSVPDLDLSSGENNLNRSLSQVRLQPIDLSPGELAITRSLELVGENISIAGSKLGGIQPEPITVPKPLTPEIESRIHAEASAFVDELVALHKKMRSVAGDTALSDAATRLKKTLTESGSALKVGVNGLSKHLLDGVQLIGEAIRGEINLRQVMSVGRGMVSEATTVAGKSAETAAAAGSVAAMTAITTTLAIVAAAVAAIAAVIAVIAVGVSFIKSRIDTLAKYNPALAQQAALDRLQQITQATQEAQILEPMYTEVSMILREIRAAIFPVILAIKTIILGLILPPLRLLNEILQYLKRGFSAILAGLVSLLQQFGPAAAASITGIISSVLGFGNPTVMNQIASMLGGSVFSAFNSSIAPVIVALQQIIKIMQGGQMQPANAWAINTLNALSSHRSSNPRLPSGGAISGSGMPLPWQVGTRPPPRKGPGGGTP